MNNPHEAIMKKSDEVSGKSITGYDFNQGVDYKKILESFETTGFQATHFSQAIKIVKKMRQENAFIMLGYTSSMVSSGLRDIFRYLAEHKLIDLIVTTGGGIEEDLIKCLGDFKLGNFSVSGEILREKGINRIGNILVPNSRYCSFESWMLPVLEKYKNKILTPSQLIKILGGEINNKESIYYWCWKNNIPVYCPAIMDGSLGDIIYFFINKNPDFQIEVSNDAVELNNSTLGKEKTGMLILGTGIIKHQICNANLYRNGADFAVYFNNAIEEDGSDAGARPDEAVSWGKIKAKGESIKVFGDVTILFPLLVARCFAE